MADQRLRRDVVWNLVPVVLLGAVGLGVNFLIAAWWGASALGVFNLVTILYFVLAVAGAWGLQYSVLRAVAEKPEDREHVAAATVGALVPNVSLAIAATALFFALRGPVTSLHSEAVAEGMLWATPGLFCFAVNKVLLGVVNGLRRMRAFAIYTSLRYVLIAIGILVARGADVSGNQLAVIWTFAEGVLLLVLVVELLATVSLRRGAGWRRWARLHLDYGSRGVAATLGYEINRKLDTWMLGAAGLSTEAVGIYSLAAALNEGAMQLAVVVQTTINPMIARELAAGKPENVDALVRRTRRWFVPSLAGAAALGALAFPLIPIVIGDPAFAAATWPFAIMMAGLALTSPYLPFGQVLLMADRPGWHTVYTLLVLTASGVANLAFIPMLGLAGGATACSVGLVVSAVFIRRLARDFAGVRL